MTTSTPSTLPPLHEAWLPREHSSYRPRHGGRQLGAIICACVFFTLPVISLGLGMRPAEIENHRLADFPSPGDGWGFFTNMATWANDHLPFRGDAITATDQISRGVFDEPPKLDRGKAQAIPGPTGFDQKQVNTDLNVPLGIEGKNGWMYYGDDVVSRCNQAHDLNTTLAQLRKLRDGVKASGRKFVLVVAPDKTTIVPENLPDTYPGKSCTQKVTGELWRMLTTESDVLDIRGDLWRWGQQLGHPVYPPLNGHWLDEGGVVMTKRLAEAIEPGVTSKWVVQPAEPWKFPSDIPPLIGRSGTDEGVYYSLKPDGLKDQARNIPIDFTTPVRLGTASGTGTVSQSVGLLGDSFTIRALRYLAGSFSDLTVLHYGEASKDNGEAAALMLADHDVVAVELVERTLASGNSVLLQPPVVDGIVRVLGEHPIR